MDSLNFGPITRDKLRPNSVPIVRTQVAARDRSAGCGFNLATVGRTGFALGISVLPLPDLRIAAGADPLAQGRDAQCIWLSQVFR